MFVPNVRINFIEPSTSPLHNNTARNKTTDCETFIFPALTRKHTLSHLKPSLLPINLHSCHHNHWKKFQGRFLSFPLCDNQHQFVFCNRATDWATLTWHWATASVTMHQHWCFTHTGKSSLPVNIYSPVCTNTWQEILNKKKADRRWILVEALQYKNVKKKIAFVKNLIFL